MQHLVKRKGVVGAALPKREDRDAAVKDGDHMSRRVSLPLPPRDPAESRGQRHVDRVSPGGARAVQRVDQNLPRRRRRETSGGGAAG
jgi:hypothetical protein